MKIKGQENIWQTNTNQKKIAQVYQYQTKIKFKTKYIRGKESHYIKIKETF